MYELLSSLDYSPIWLSLRLSLFVSIILIGVCTPLAWFASKASRSTKALLSSISALPLVLPPSVLGFYMLMLLGNQGPLSFLGEWANLAFSFPGLVIASLVYSLPFAIQPIQNAFEQIDPKLLEAASTLRASNIDLFFSIVLPLAKPGFITALILSFAHTMGEFGVILMIGGNIPGETRVLSIAIYDHVEALEYGQAHILSAGMLAFSFVTLFLLYLTNGTKNALIVRQK